MEAQLAGVAPLGACHDSRGRRWEVALLLALVVAIYCPRLARQSVCGEESRWGVAAREMLAGGDFIVPRQQGEVFPERPPLGSWAMALAGSCRGQVDLVAVRLPSVVATLGMVLVIYGYAQTWMSRLGGFAAAAMYATFGQVLQLGRLGESEALFTFFTASAILGWHWGYLTARSPAATWCLGYSLAALGSLVKGPQAPVYFIAATGAYLVLLRDWRWLASWGHVLGIACFAAIVGAWLVPFAISNPAAVDDVWAGLAGDRFHIHGLAAHLAAFPFETFGCLLPWSPLLIGLAKPGVFKSILAKHPEAKFLLVALAVTYPTVWLAAGARGRYYMPMYPCLAVLLGLVVEHCTARAASLADRLIWRRFLRVMAVVMLAGGAVVVAASLAPLEILAEVAQSGPFVALWIACVLAAAAIVGWCSLGEDAPRPQVAILALAAFLGFAYSGLMLNIRVWGGNDLAPEVARLKERLAGGELVSLGRIYHRFVFSYEEPIRLVAWPSSADELANDVTWFCFDHRPGDTPEERSAGDGRLAGTTPGTLPFEWDEIARIDCDPVRRAVHNRTLIVGRVRRQQNLAQPAVSRPERR